MKQIVFVIKYFRFLINVLSQRRNNTGFWKEINEKVFIYSDNQDFKLIEIVRQGLLKDNKTIEIKDFGAGYNVNPSRTRRISDIAKNSSKKARFGKILYNLIKHYSPDTILELGTSLGISTLYLAMANEKAKVITLEGCPQTANVAQTIFNGFNLKNIELVTGNFDDTLMETLNKTDKLDFVFIDGNHREEPTIDYFHKCLQKSNYNTIFVFDDIHWSRGMENAWEYISHHNEVSVSIDCFFVGIIFFRKDIEKQHYYKL